MFGHVTREGERSTLEQSADVSWAGVCVCCVLWGQILDRLEKEGVSEVNTNVGRKFGYVVSCQVYGKMKMNQDSKVTSHDNPNNICTIHIYALYFKQELLKLGDDLKSQKLRRSFSTASQPHPWL